MWFSRAVSWAVVLRLSALKLYRWMSTMISFMASAVGRAGGAGGILAGMLSTLFIISSLSRLTPVDVPSAAIFMKPLRGMEAGQAATPSI